MRNKTRGNALPPVRVAGGSSQSVRRRCLGTDEFEPYPVVASAGADSLNSRMVVRRVALRGFNRCAGNDKHRLN